MYDETGIYEDFLNNPDDDTEAARFETYEHIWRWVIENTPDGDPETAFTNLRDSKLHEEIPTYVEDVLDALHVFKQQDKSISGVTIEEVIYT